MKNLPQRNHSKNCDHTLKKTSQQGLNQVGIPNPSTLLWGCESWNVTEKNLKKLFSFHHLAICRILGKKRDQVQKQKITNEEVRNRLNNILCTNTYIIQ